MSKILDGTHALDAILSQAMIDTAPLGMDCPVFNHDGKKYIIFGCGWPTGTAFDAEKMTQIVASADFAAALVKEFPDWTLDMGYPNSVHVMKAGTKLRFETPIGGVAFAMEITG